MKQQNGQGKRAMFIEIFKQKYYQNCRLSAPAGVPKNFFHTNVHCEHKKIRQIGSYSQIMLLHTTDIFLKLITYI